MRSGTTDDRFSEGNVLHAGIFLEHPNLAFVLIAVAVRCHEKRTCDSRERIESISILGVD